jgi:hypothetical protein
MIMILTATLLLTAQDAPAAGASQGVSPPTRTAPRPKTEMKPKENVDPGIQLPPNQPVDKPAAPSAPGQPGVRPL